SWGDQDPVCDQHAPSGANFDRCAWRKPLVAGSFPPNRFGLFDMHGNVWEWVQDCWHANYNGAPTDGSAWLSGDCSLRVMRGGSWNDPAQNLRSAVRDIGSASGWNQYVGFRVARSL